MFCSKKKKLHIFFGDEATHILMFVVCLMFFIGVFSHAVFLSGGKSRLGPGSKSFPVPKKNLVVTGHAGEGSHIQCIHPMLGGGFKYFLFSPRTLGKMNPF